MIWTVFGTCCITKNQSLSWVCMHESYNLKHSVTFFFLNEILLLLLILNIAFFFNWLYSYWSVDSTSLLDVLGLSASDAIICFYYCCVFGLSASGAIICYYYCCLEFIWWDHGSSCEKVPSWYCTEWLHCGNSSCVSDISYFTEIWLLLTRSLRFIERSK